MYLITTKALTCKYNLFTAENLTRNDLIESYNTSCEKHGVRPLADVLKLLEVR